MSVSVVPIAGACELGEGPCWEEASQSLLYVDIRGQTVHRWRETNQERLEFDDIVSFIIPRQNGGGYISGLGRKLVSFEWGEHKKYNVYAEVETDTQNKMNDGKCDSSGRLWTGTYCPKEGRANFEPEAGSLYSLDVDGTLTKHLGKITVSNGLAWSIDDKTMYYVDSIPRKVYAFDFDVTAGTISNQRTAIDLSVKPWEVTGYPDGICMDTEDKLWVASFGTGFVFRFDPKTGKEIQRIETPGAKQVTSCCWGGRHYDELYVTTAFLGMTEEEHQQQPNAGRTFKVSGLGIKGLPPVHFAG